MTRLVEASVKVWEVDPRGDGGFEEVDVTPILVSIVAEIGMAGFNEDNGFKTKFSEDGCEEDAGIDTVGLTGVADFVKETDVLYVGSG